MARLYNFLLGFLIIIICGSKRKIKYREWSYDFLLKRICEGSIPIMGNFKFKYNYQKFLRECLAMALKFISSLSRSFPFILQYIFSHLLLPSRDFHQKNTLFPLFIHISPISTNISFGLPIKKHRDNKSQAKLSLSYNF